VVRADEDKPPPFSHRHGRGSSRNRAYSSRPAGRRLEADALADVGAAALPARCLAGPPRLGGDAAAPALTAAAAAAAA
jgi:hypothetical protein